MEVNVPNNLNGPPEEGELVLLEVKKIESLPRTLKTHFNLNPRLVAYRGQEKRGVWFQVPGANLEGRFVSAGEGRNWGAFSFFLPWKQIVTILRVENRPAVEEGIGF
jgi:hypothetical protein